MNWLLRNAIRELGGVPDLPDWALDAEEAWLESAGVALASSVRSLELLDALGDDVDRVAAMLLAELN